MAKADKDILDKAREDLKSCVDEESIERNKMEDDLRFCTLDQWPEQIRRDRETDPNGARPCLTIDKINQYIVQVVNDMRQNRPSIKVRPVDDNADVQTAKVFQGLVRHIEDYSSAQVAYQVAGESAVKIGMGFFRIITKYVNGKDGEQELCIKPIPNAFSVYLGPHIMPDGSDAKTAFVVEEVPLKQFKKDYPDAKYSAESFAELENTPNLTWRTEASVTILEYFYFEGEQLKWVKMTGVEVLDQRALPGKYIPVVEVIGRESYVRGRRILWGLVRPAKDSLRMNNYWMSAITEKIGLAPKVPFVGAKGQFEGVEQAWKNANKESRAYLEFAPISVDGTVLPAPQRVAPAPIEVAMVNMTALIERDVKASLGMYKAAVGEAESQQSGRAILALQKESDTGTMHFADNQAISIRHAGRILIDLIPHYYDTRRVIRILGEDNEPQTVTLDPDQQVPRMSIPTADGKIKSIYNLGVGTYDVTTTVGPSYTTKRQEVATLFTELANSAKDPVSANVMRYIAVKNSDFEQSDEALAMLKALLPPPLQKVGENQQIPPQAQAQIMQLTQLVQAAKQKIDELESGAQVAQAKIQSDHQLAAQQAAQAHQEQMAKEAKEAEEARIEDQRKRTEMENEAQLVIAKAQIDAAAKIKIAEINAACDREAAGIKAESDQNIAFMKQEATTEEGKEPKGGGLKNLMQGMAELMQAMMQANQQMMQHHEKTMAAMMQMQSAPKTISGTLPSGAHMTATVRTGAIN